MFTEGHKQRCKVSKKRLPFYSQFSCKWVGLSSGILGPCYNCHQITQTPRRSIKGYEECSVPVGCCLSISLASFYIDSECSLQVFLGLAIFAKRDKHCSEVHVGCCFPISATNFYFDSESFLQVFSGLVVFPKRSEQCSDFPVACSLSISVANFYFDSECFLQ